jgi:2',3'-cyclic-nucleotide 2'-phosphodiesterase
MNILYIGDIMGPMGIEVVRRVLPELRERGTLQDGKYLPIDLVIAQSENVSDGKSMTISDRKILAELGVDAFSGGNHSHKKTEIHAALKDPDQPVVAPGNMAENPGQPWKMVKMGDTQVLMISILGSTVGDAIDKTNPLSAIDDILQATSGHTKAATVVNFHGDYSSEKRVFGYYLDGRVSAVIGDHWHVPTADAMILPKGTAHITDVGMCGTLHSSIGVELDVIISRWRDQVVNKNTLDKTYPLQFNAVLLVNATPKGSEKIVQIQKLVAEA